MNREPRIGILFTGYGWIREWTTVECHGLALNVLIANTEQGAMDWLMKSWYGHGTGSQE